MWQSITIEEPMKPMAPMPMLLPSSLNSSSSAAIFGSGLREPTTRKQDACLPSTMLVSFEPPSPMPTIAGPYQRIEIEALDPLDAVPRKQHPIVGAEQAPFVHGNEVEPIGVGMEGVLDLGCADADIVVVIGTPERMHAVGPQRHAGGGARGRAPQGRLKRNRPALDARLIADLDVPTRQAGIAAHGAAVLLGSLVVLEHRLDDEGGEVAFFGVGAFAQPGEIILRD